MRMKAASFFVFLLFAFVCTLPAQEITGTISGAVSDSSGAAVPLATVAVPQLETGDRGPREIQLALKLIW